VGVDFKTATDRLTAVVTLADVAAELDLAENSVRRARMETDSPNARAAPPEWKAAVARLARKRSRELEALADRLSGGARDRSGGWRDARQEGPEVSERWIFARRVDEMVPELRRSLRSDVLPSARRLLEAEEGSVRQFKDLASHLRDGTKALAEAARELGLRAEGDGHGFAEVFGRWGRRWNLLDGWELAAAARTIALWLEGQEAGTTLLDHPPSPSALGEVSLTLETAPLVWLGAREHWNAFKKRAQRRFEHGLADFKQVAEHHFEKEGLVRYRTPKNAKKGKSDDRHYRILVRFQVLGHSLSDIARDEHSTRLRVGTPIRQLRAEVSKTVHGAAGLVGITVRTSS
jgi:hypothetical protein